MLKSKLRSHDYNIKFRLYDYYATMTLYIKLFFNFKIFFIRPNKNIISKKTNLIL